MNYRSEVRGGTPAEILGTNVVLTPAQVAIVLGLLYTRGAKQGEPNRRRVIELVDAGKLTPVDPEQPWWRWTFSTQAVAAYANRTVAA
jgi:hypothetical protein